MTGMAKNPRRRRRTKASCRALVSRVISKEVRAGTPQDQAVAIGLSKARRAGCRVPPPPRDNPCPSSGWAVGTNRGYVSYHGTRAAATKAAQEWANRTRNRADVVRIQNRGEDRFIVEQIEPRRDNPCAPCAWGWARVFG